MIHHQRPKLCFLPKFHNTC